MSGMSIVAHNLPGMSSNRQLGIVSKRKGKSTEKLSSGYKINRAADDAAGLSISEKMRKQIRGLTQGTDNAQDGVSMCQTADGALAEVQDMLHRITELSVKAANGTNSPSDRQDIQSEINEILKEIDRVSTTTKFNEELLFARGLSSSGMDGSGGASGAGKTRVVTEPSGTPVIVGDFKVTGGTQGRDYDFDSVNRLLTIKTDAALKISNVLDGWTTDCIEIADGVNARIILSNVDISNASTAALKIADNSTGNVTITLDGDNMLHSGGEFAGIQKNGVTGSLTINGTGNLTVQGGYGAAGIGSGYNFSTSNIVIDGGIISAVGGGSGRVNGHTVLGQTAGIGSGDNGDASHITISGGSIIASGFVGIGGGGFGDASHITISGGSVKAIGTVGPGIGGGQGTAVSNITISGGTVEAQGGYYSAGIGGCEETSVSDIMISGGTIIAQGGYKAAGIGGGYGRGASNITISGGNVTATGGDYGAGIGGGSGGGASHITISGGQKVIANGGYLASGIGGGTGGLAYDINITGGDEVMAKGGGLLAENIGSGHGAHAEFSSKFKSSRDEVHISGGTVREENGYTIYNGYGSTPENGPGNSSTNTNEYKKWWIQTGCDNSDDNGIYLEIGQMNTKILGIYDLDVSSIDGARDAIGRMEPALLKLNDIRSRIGAQQNRLEHTIKHQNNTIENTQHAESVIRDTDIAEEMVRFSKESILEQAGQAMLSQANQSNQGILSLLQ